MMVEEAVQTQALEEMVVSKPVLVTEGNKSTVSFSVKENGKTHDIWFRTDKLPNMDYSNTALASTLLTAMKLNLALRFEGSISPRLLQGISTIQNIFHAWYEDFSLVNVIAAEHHEAQERKVHNKGVACFFSGGVDSFYTVLKHKDEITHLILVHGFDFKLSDIKLRDQISQSLRSAAQELGKSLIEVETNLRDLGNRHLKWGEHFFGSALASVALLLSPYFRKVIVAAGDAYRDLHPWGSHPLVDPLWSTEETQIVLDGCESGRFNKILRITSHDVVLRNLRVCWENRNGNYNCGQCEKCLRTMISLKALRLLHRCTTFENKIDLVKVRRMIPSHHSILAYMLENLKAIEKNNEDRELIAALRDAVSGLHSKGISGWPKRAVNFLKKGARSRYVVST